MRNFIVQHISEKNFYYDKNLTWVEEDNRHVFKTESEFKKACNLQASRGKFSVMHKLWNKIEVK